MPPAKPSAASGSSPRATGSTRRAAYKVNPGLRIGAALVDVLLGSLPLIFFVFVGLVPVGALLLALYLLLRDGLPIAALEYQSVGKKLVGLHVEVERTGKSRLDPATSVKRNLPIAAGVLLFAVVSIFSPMLGALIAAVPPIIELVFMLQDPNGLRFGDKLAGTKVLD